MNDAAYFQLVKIIARFYRGGRLLGGENLPKHGPAVFVANHLGPQGPIGAICTIPLRFYPWIVAEMLDRRLAPDYLRLDFVETTLRMKPPLSRAFAWALSLVTVPMLTAFGCLPVDRDDYANSQSALQSSLSLLKAGKFVLVYPEDPRREPDPQTGMKPFLKGFTRLWELFYAETGERLRFYPVAVHESKSVRLGEPVLFDPDNPRGLERQRLKDRLETRIIAMYLGEGEYVDNPT